MYVGIDTEKFEVLGFDGQVVAQLAFFGQEIALFLVGKVKLVLSEGSNDSIFDPVGQPFRTGALSLDFNNSTTPQKEHFLWVPLEVSKVPNPGDDQRRRAIQEEAVPVPSQLKGINDKVQERDGDQRFI